MICFRAIGLLKTTGYWDISGTRFNTDLQLYRKLQVLIDGTIQGCSCRVEPELWGNNIKKYSNLKDAWRDEKIEKIRNDWFKGKLKKCCRECSHYLPYTKLFSENYLIQNIKEYILSKIKKNKVIVKQGKKSKNQM